MGPVALGGTTVESQMISQEFPISEKGRKLRRKKRLLRDKKHKALPEEATPTT